MALPFDIFTRELTPIIVTELEPLHQNYPILFDLLTHQNWLTILTTGRNQFLSIPKTQEFYANLYVPDRPSSNFIVTYVRRKRYIISEEVIQKALCLPDNGIILENLYLANLGFPDHESMIKFIYEPYANYQNEPHALNLRIQYLLIHKLLIQTFWPDRIGTVNVEAEDAFYILCVSNKIKLNMASVILNHMKHILNTDYNLPYAGIIKTIIDYCNSPFLVPDPRLSHNLPPEYSAEYAYSENDISEDPMDENDKSSKEN